MDETDELTHEEMDEIIEKYAKDADQRSDNTRHTAIENPTFGILISEKCINTYINRIEIKSADEYKVTYKRPFKRHHYYVTVRRGQEKLI
ncbi:hypothetical protein HHI36_023921 [Cryptolaemus montrouzieri]|uniref:Uncharacterized protein n=1 Tax=Cryptolaemus montrouzieri TaxID=559131 RepID=A0ABD2NYA0_9CUCU